MLGVKASLHPYYLASDCVVCPSNSEVLPYVILEAMQASRPVIASKIDGIPEIISHGENGFLIDDFDRPVSRQMNAYLSQLIDDKSLRETLAQNALNTLKTKFNKTEMIKAYRSLIVG